MEEKTVSRELEEGRGDVRWCEGDINTLKEKVGSKFLFIQGWLCWQCRNTFILPWEQLHLALSFHLNLFVAVFL